MAFTNRDLRVYTSTLVREDARVLLVFHDDDGTWQFLASTERSADEIVLAHIAHLIDTDGGLHAVADLPLGWMAWREAPDEPWLRQPTPEDQPEI